MRVRCHPQRGGSHCNSHCNSLGILKVNSVNPFNISKLLTRHYFKHLPASFTPQGVCLSDLRGAIWRSKKEGLLAKRPLLGESYNLGRTVTGPPGPDRGFTGPAKLFSGLSKRITPICEDHCVIMGNSLKFRDLRVCLGHRQGHC